MRPRRYRHIAERVFGTPLMIEPAKLEVIAELLLPRFLEAGPLEQLPAAAVEVTEARAREDMTVVDGIAVVDVFGTLVQREDRLNAISGLTSYESLDREFTGAVRDPSVKGVLLVIDSPGGEANGVFDFANRIYGLADNPKPVWAVVEDLAASSAYLIGSAANRLFVTQSAIVGSIGVVLAHWDMTKRLSDAGVKVTQIHAGARKIDSSMHRPMDAAARAHLQQLVDDTYGLFVSQVSRNRSISERAVRATEARIYQGARAVELGLADGVQTVSEALALLQDELERREIALLEGPGTATVGGSTMPAIRPHKTATSEKSWDGPANEARLRNDGTETYYRSAYAWIDPDGDPTTKAAYKFINHEVAQGGDVGAANVNGCSAGIAVLNGGRGGGPGAKWWKDRQGIYDHLAKHIRDHGREAPPLKNEAEARVAWEAVMAEEKKSDTLVVDKSQAVGKTEALVTDADAGEGDDAGADLKLSVSVENGDDVRREAAEAERNRIAAIEELAGPGREALIAKFKADPDATPEKAALQILKHEKGKQAARLAALRADDADVELEASVDAGEVSDEAQEVQRTLAVFYDSRGIKPH